MKLPVIVGMGGINSAGRTSGHHAYKRLVHDELSVSQMLPTWQDLAHRMGLSNDLLTAELIDRIQANTLIRRIDNIDVDHIYSHQPASLQAGAKIILKKSKIPAQLLEYCDVEPLNEQEVSLTLRDDVKIFLADSKPSKVTSGGCLPKNFDPGSLYHSLHHPRGLKMAVYAASDALNSLGIPWETIQTHVRPDEISVYAGSALSQIDPYSLAGMIAEPLLGNRINSKMIAMSLAEMPADFVNGYVINSVGCTGHNMGACATFLYNLRQGVQDIQYGKAKIVIVGSAEAPIEPAIIDGFRVMGALATDEQLCALDNTDSHDHRRACRPFSTNVGFTLAESAQFVVLMSDELAVTLGANILGAVADVFINADGNKKSIASPGIGNYVTVAKATALAKAMLGQSGLNKTYIQAHGTGTPQNRTTESHILNEIAKTFAIQQWPVAAIKSYLGHSISAAAGDQLSAALGVWQYGIIPGIKTIDHIAADVHQSHLHILQSHYPVGPMGRDISAVLINAKGFGGNNATALVLSPQQTLKIISNKLTGRALNMYQQKNTLVNAHTQELDAAACQGEEKISYCFGEQVIAESAVTITERSIHLAAFHHHIELPITSPY